MIFRLKTYTYACDNQMRAGISNNVINKKYQANEILRARIFTKDSQGAFFSM